MLVVLGLLLMAGSVVISWATISKTGEVFSDIRRWPGGETLVHTLIFSSIAGGLALLLTG